MRNVCTYLGDVVSCWHHRGLRYLLIALVLLDFLGRAFVMVCGECRVIISSLLNISSLSFCRKGKTVAEVSPERAKGLFLLV